MGQSVEWEQLPAAVRRAVEQHTGPVTGTSPGGQGLSTDIRLILHTRTGDVFVKGTGPDAAGMQRDRLSLGAALAPHVTPLGPPLLWRAAQADGWDITGWPALPGRPADLTTGSADIPKLTALLAELGTIQAPAGIAMRSVREDWGYFSDNTADLDGNNLVHTDPHAGNFIVHGDRAWLLDWGWAMRGPAWVTAARFILFLMEAGWKPADAEQAVATVPAWAQAPPAVITADAAASIRSWERAVRRQPDNEGLRRWLGLTRAWAEYRDNATQGQRFLPELVCTTRLATVVVHVHHPGLRGDCLGHLVYVACRRDAGPDVKELAYPRLGSEEADGAAEERPVRPRREGQLRVDLERLLHRRPVNLVVVLAAEQVVVYARLIRLRGVKRQRPGLAPAQCRCLIGGHLGSPVGIGPRAIPAFHYCQHRNAYLIPAAQPALWSEYGRPLTVADLMPGHRTRRLSRRQAAR
jgi:hypothetical protein